MPGRRKWPRRVYVEDVVDWLCDRMRRFREEADHAHVERAYDAESRLTAKADEMWAAACAFHNEQLAATKAKRTVRGGGRR